jgi:hypothetical protein
MVVPAKDRRLNAAEEWPFDFARGKLRARRGQEGNRRSHRLPTLPSFTNETGELFIKVPNL